MSTSNRRAAECPSWTSLARFVEKGGPWPAEHLRSCSACRKRRQLLQGLSALGDTGQGGMKASKSCPDLLEIAALVDGHVEHGERLRLAEHIAACESCAGLLRELVAFSADEGADWEVREGPAAVVPESAQHGPWASSGFRRIAALLLIAAALAIIYITPFPPIESGEGGRWRGPAPRLEAAASWPLRAKQPLLTWDEWPGASSYRIRVWNESGSRLLERHVASGEARRLTLSISIPQDGSSSAPRDGDLLFWQVDALDAGEVAASTGPAELRWQSR